MLGCISFEAKSNPFIILTGAFLSTLVRVNEKAPSEFV